MPATADEERVPSFTELGMPPSLVNALARQGIDKPFPIQAAAIPDIMAGRDVLGRGKTGSGKTLAFGLPLLVRLSGRKAAPKRPLALILVPTRELAQQVQTNLEPLGRGLGLRFKTVIGQTSMFKQIDALRRGVEILVATPGRLKDLMRQGACDLSDIEIAVLDEADHMADMGFLPDVTDILDQAKPGGQRMLFSATLDKDVDVLVKRYLDSPVTHAIGPVDEPVDTMDHHLLLVAPRRRPPSPPRSPTARAGRSCSPAPSTESTGSPSSSSRPESARPASTAARARASAPAPSPNSAKAPSASWSPPTSPPAASTSTTSPSSCTSTPRPTTRTTCTAPDAPPAPANAAPSSPSSCRTRCAPPPR